MFFFVFPPGTTLRSTSFVSMTTEMLLQHISSEFQKNHGMHVSKASKLHVRIGLRTLEVLQDHETNLRPFTSSF